MPMTNYLENKVLQGTVGNATYTAPATVYMALYSTTNTKTTAGTEIAGNGYSRQSVAFGTAALGEITSTGNVSFSASGNAWPIVVSAAIMDASSAGNMLYFYNGPARLVNAGDTLEYATGEITITIS